MKKLKHLIACALTLSSLCGCSALLSSQNNSYDDMYGTVSSREIINKQEAEIAALKEKQALYEAILNSEQYAAEMENSSNDQYIDILADDYQSAYARRLRSFESTTYIRPASYYELRFSPNIHYVSAYDPAFYNVVVMGDQVWVEPRYISSMFGYWGRPAYFSYHRPWRHNSWAWGWGPYYSVWGYPHHSWHDWRYTHYWGHHNFYWGHNNFYWGWGNYRPNNRPNNRPNWGHGSLRPNNSKTPNYRTQYSGRTNSAPSKSSTAASSANRTPISDRLNASSNKNSTTNATGSRSNSSSSTYKPNSTTTNSSSANKSSTSSSSKKSSSSTSSGRTSSSSFRSSSSSSSSGSRGSSSSSSSGSRGR